MVLSRLSLQHQVKGEAPENLPGVYVVYTQSGQVMPSSVTSVQAGSAYLPESPNVNRTSQESQVAKPMQRALVSTTQKIETALLCISVHPQEIDYRLEGKNADMFRENFKDVDWVKVPRVYWEYSGAEVLVLEYAPGGFQTLC